MTGNLLMRNEKDILKEVFTEIKHQAPALPKEDIKTILKFIPSDGKKAYDDIYKEVSEQFGLKAENLYVAIAQKLLSVERKRQSKEKTLIIKNPLHHDDDIQNFHDEDPSKEIDFSDTRKQLNFARLLFFILGLIAGYILCLAIKS